MPTLLIHLDEAPERVAMVTALAAALAEAQLLTVRPAVVITTADMHVVAILQPYSQVLADLETKYTGGG